MHSTQALRRTAYYGVLSIYSYYDMRLKYISARILPCFGDAHMHKSLHSMLHFTSTYDPVTFDTARRS